MSPPRPAVHGGNPWSLLASSSADASAILDFSADLNPLGPPPSMRALLREAVSRVGWYPEPSYREFREEVARAEGVEPDQILPGNGTADLIHLISRWRAGGKVLVATPTFTEYERAAAADGSQVIPWPAAEEEAFAHSLPAALGSGIEGGLLFLCNPNNPTGVLWPRDRLLEVIARAEPLGAVVVVDEAYMDLAEDGCRYSLAAETARQRHLLVLRSLTKSFAIPGLRVGYAVASVDLVRRLALLQPPWSVNALAAHVGARLVREQGHLAESRSRILAFRLALEAELARLGGLASYRSCANFLLCRLSDSTLTGAELAARLAERGILIRVCDDFTGLAPGRFIRIAVHQPDQNRRLLDALREIFIRAG